MLFIDVFTGPSTLFDLLRLLETWRHNAGEFSLMPSIRILSKLFLVRCASGGCFTYSLVFWLQRELHMSLLWHGSLRVVKKQVIYDLAWRYRSWMQFASQSDSVLGSSLRDQFLVELKAGALILRLLGRLLRLWLHQLNLGLSLMAEVILPPQLFHRLFLLRFLIQHHILRVFH